MQTKEEIKATQKKWRNTKAGKKAIKRAAYKSLYGVTLESIEKAVEDQKGRCKICGTKKKLVVDHDHKANKFRAMLCYRCNIAIGYVEKEPTLLSKISKYLDYHKDIWT